MLIFSASLGWTIYTFALSRFNRKQYYALEYVMFLFQNSEIVRRVSKGILFFALAQQVNRLNLVQG